LSAGQSQEAEALVSLPKTTNKSASNKAVTKKPATAKTKAPSAKTSEQAAIKEQSPASTHNRISPALPPSAGPATALASLATPPTTNMDSDDDMQSLASSVDFNEDAGIGSDISLEDGMYMSRSFRMGENANFHDSCVNRRIRRA